MMVAVTHADASSEAIIAKLVEGKSTDPKLTKARTDKGILVASGLVAGAAILEVVLNLMGNFDWSNRILQSIDLTQRRVAAGADPASLAQMNNWLGLVAFVILCLIVYWDCRRARPEPALKQ